MSLKKSFLAWYRRLSEKVQDVETFRKFCELSIMLVIFYILIEFDQIPNGCQYYYTTSGAKGAETSCKIYPYPDEYNFRTCSSNRASCFDYLDVINARLTEGLSPNDTATRFKPFCECLTAADDKGANCDLTAFQAISSVASFAFFIYILVESRTWLIALLYIAWNVLMFIGLTAGVSCRSDEYFTKHGVMMNIVFANIAVMAVLFLLTLVFRAIDRSIAAVVGPDGKGASDKKSAWP